jgi:Chaperone of endosialidase
MSQFDFGTIDPNVKTGTQLASDLNAWRTALHSTHAGVARPSYAIPGMLWVDQVSATDWRLKLASATGDVVVGNVNPSTNVIIPQKFPDGALATPSVAFTSEPGLGIYRGAAGTLAIASGGSVLLSASPSLLAVGSTAFQVNGNQTVLGTLHVDGVTTLTGQATSAGFVATGANTAFAYPAAINCAHYSQGLVQSGTGAAGSFASFNLLARDGAGNYTTNPVYQWGPSAGTGGLGTHFFSQLAGQAGNETCKLFITGPVGSTTQLGVGLLAFNANDQVGLTAWQVTTPTAGAETSLWRTSIARAGTVTAAGDISVERSTVTSLPQFIVRGGNGGTIANAAEAAIKVLSPSSFASICLHSSGGTPSVWMEAGNVMYWGYNNSPGPVSGWSMILTAAGAVTAAGFTPCDAALKTDVQPCAEALAGVLRLRGVRFRNRHDGQPNMGLIAQDVQAAFPEAVGRVRGPEPGSPEILTVQYGALFGPMIEALREIDARVKALEAAPA